jgi:hypothetical protein
MGFFPFGVGSVENFSGTVHEGPYFPYNLKLRMGYGEVGNANVGAFAYSANLSNSPTIWGTGALRAMYLTKI